MRIIYVALCSSRYSGVERKTAGRVDCPDMNSNRIHGCFSVARTVCNENHCEVEALSCCVWHLNNVCIFKGSLGSFFGLSKNKYTNQMTSNVAYLSALNHNDRLSRRNRPVSTITVCDLRSMDVLNEAQGMENVLEKICKVNGAVDTRLFENLPESLPFSIEANTSSKTLGRFGSFSESYGDEVFLRDFFPLSKSAEEDYNENSLLQ